MSYARFGWDGSDVYVFDHVAGAIECCGCNLSGVSQYFTDLADLFAHLDAHEAAGHVVPTEVRPEILADWRAGEFAEWDGTDPAWTP